jgi:hypothetical protein
MSALVRRVSGRDKADLPVMQRSEMMFSLSLPAKNSRLSRHLARRMREQGHPAPSTLAGPA